MSLPMLMGSYSTKHLLKIITGVVLVICDPWVDPGRGRRHGRAVADVGTSGRAAPCALPARMGRNARRTGHAHST